MAFPQPSAPSPSLQRPGVAAPPSYTPQQSVAALTAASQNRLTVVAANHVRLRAVADRLDLLLRCGISSGPSDLFHLIFALARGIDYALSVNDIPGIANRLPSLIIQVYQRRNDPLLRSAIMVLMISAKNACKNRWFLSPDVNELLSMANELCSSFCMSASDTIVGSAQDTISKIMPRFYPQLQFCRLVVSFEAKPGYDILMADFHVPRNTRLDERIAIGYFSGMLILLLLAMDGNYMIAIAFMSKVTIPYATRLDDYVHPVIEKLGSDWYVLISTQCANTWYTIMYQRFKEEKEREGGGRGGDKGRRGGRKRKEEEEAVEKEEERQEEEEEEGEEVAEEEEAGGRGVYPINGSSTQWRMTRHIEALTIRTELFKRIKTPVKGHLCKHHQILQEVGENVADIVIFADGSWNSFVEHNESINQVHEGRFQQQENSNTSTNVVDLTIAKSPEVGPFQNSANTAENYGCEIEDRKLFRDDEGLPISLYVSGASVINTSLCTQAPAYYTESGIRPRNMSSVSSSVSGRMVGANANTVGTLESILPDVLLNPIHTDAVSPVLNRNPAGFELSQPTLNFQQVPQVTQLAEIAQLEPMHEGSLINNNEAGRPIPRQVIKTPRAVQAFPAQTQIPNSSRMVQTAVADALNSVSGEMQINELSWTSSIAVASLHSMAQEHHHNYSALQQVVGLSSPNMISTRTPQGQPRGVDAYRAAIVHSLLEHPPQLPYQRRHHLANPSGASQPSYISSSQAQQVSHNAAYVTEIGAGTTHSTPLTPQHAAQRATRQTGATSIPPAAGVASVVPTLTDAGRAPPSFGSDGLPALPYEHNWRPTGRMRGSLTGYAYSSALNQYLATPQSAQTQPPPFSAGVPADWLPASTANALCVQASIAQQSTTGHIDGNRSRSSYGIFDTYEQMNH
ncbi:MIZ/SP-RING zinc finger [Musa troglodytarum]|uniref:MIZ/SP-RING zinc finger n=1 Tax=Musa troglodytarum TaxID=320322 RepID=A0A9E7KA97_9LILI|nr:MIZ/SP-RING zinc finger [Musa troglodytarum]